MSRVVRPTHRTGGRARGPAGRICRHWALNPHPTLIPAKRLLANVNGVKNAVLVEGDAVGPTLYYGAGAGAFAKVLEEMIKIAPEDWHLFVPNWPSDREEGA